MWKLQTILIPRSWGKKNANKYIKDGGYKLKFAGKPVDVTDNFFRYRQSRPVWGSKYRSKTLDNGVQLVYIHKK